MNYNSCNSTFALFYQPKKMRTKTAKNYFRCSTNDDVLRNIYLGLKLLIVVYLLKTCSLVLKTVLAVHDRCGIKLFPIIYVSGLRNTFNNTSWPTLLQQMDFPAMHLSAYPHPPVNRTQNLTILHIRAGLHNLDETSKDAG